MPSVYCGSSKPPADEAHDACRCGRAIRTLAAKGITTGWHADTAPGLLASLRPREGTDTEAEYRKIAAVPLLLLDDLGTAKASEWTEEILYRLVNDRYTAMLPGLFTSNIPAPQLRGALGDFAERPARLRAIRHFDKDVHLVGGHRGVIAMLD